MAGADLFANATLFSLTATTPFSDTVPSNAAYGYPESGEPQPAGYSVGHSAWWKFVAPDNGHVHIHTAGSSGDTEIAIYTGSAVNALTTIASDSDSYDGLRSKIPAAAVTAGTTYYIQVAEYAGATASYQLNVWFLQSAIPHDAWASAKTVSISTGGATFTDGWWNASTATTEAGEPVTVDGFVGGKTLWWKYTPLSSGSATFSLANTLGLSAGPDTLLGIYTGSAVNALTMVASDDDSGGNTTSAVTYSVTAGITYYIQAIATNYGSTPNLAFNLAVTGPASVVDNSRSATGALALDAGASPPPNAGVIAFEAIGSGVDVTRTSSTVLSIVGSAGVGVGRGGTASLSLSAVNSFGVQGFPPGASLIGGTYVQRMMARDPVAYWRFGGNLIDSAHGHNGFLAKTYTNPTGFNTAQYGASLLPGDPNQSLALQAQVSVVATGGSWADLEDFTFEGFFEITSTLTYPGAIMARASVDHFGWGLLLDGTDLLFTVGGSTDVIDLPWGAYHFAVTGDETVLKLYLNGALVSTMETIPANNVDADFQFGAPLPGYSFEAFPGRLDEFVYFNRALSALDVYDDWQIWTLGQTGALTLQDGVETASSLVMRVGDPSTYRRTVVADDPWAYWSLRNLNVFSAGDSWHVDDFGERGHPATSYVFEATDMYLGRKGGGPGVFDRDPENPTLLRSSDGVYVESENDLSSSDFTVSAWLAIPNQNGAPYPPHLLPTPLLCLAPSIGAATFDKCLYLDTSGRLCWRTGIGGSVETIVDPTPFPNDGVPRHVVASVGPAGTKIRISGTTRVTGANTSSWTGAQKVYIFNGGNDGVLDLSHEEPDLVVWFQATIYDAQLSDAQTNRHRIAGRSYRNIAYFWGYPDVSSSAFDRDLTGFVSPFTGSPSLIPGDTNTSSGTLSNGILGDSVTGAWPYLSTSSASPPQELRHVLWEPTTVSGTQYLWGALTYAQEFINPPIGITQVYLHWKLRCINGVITFDDISETNFLTPESHFTHSVSVVAGRVNAIGFYMSGATVDIWVNGVKETFTRPRSTGYSVSGADNIHTYAFGGTVAVGPFTTYAETMSGRVQDYVYNNWRSYELVPPLGDTLALPELFFEDLYNTIVLIQAGLPAIPEVETVYELTAGLPVANQTLTLDAVDDVETVYAFPQSHARIQTIIEIGQVGGFARPDHLGIVTTQGAGRIVMVDENVEFLGAELRLNILETTVYRAPTSITVTLGGGVAQEDVVFAIDGTPVLTVSLDSNGELGPTSINLSAALGTAGDHDLSVTQTTEFGVTADTQTFTVLYDPSPLPDPPATPVPPVDVPAALSWDHDALVRHWVFQDLLAPVDGGIGDYVLPHNPVSMTSPHYEHMLTAKHSTAHDGKNHVFQGGNTPKEWTFTGYCPSEAQQARMTEYRYLSRRFYVIDHRNRAWTVVLTDAQFVPRRRQNYNGVDTDWGSDFTITAAVLDQDYQTPEEA